MSSYDDVIARATEAVHEARLDLEVAIRKACPQPHRFVQHRDKRPPWCPACRYTADGERIDEKGIATHA